MEGFTTYKNGKKVLLTGPFAESIKKSRLAAAQEAERVQALSAEIREAAKADAAAKAAAEKAATRKQRARRHKVGKPERIALAQYRASHDVALSYTAELTRLSTILIAELGQREDFIVAKKPDSTITAIRRAKKLAALLAEMGRTLDTLNESMEYVNKRAIKLGGLCDKNPTLRSYAKDL